MSYIPGSIVSTFQTKSGKKAIIRCPRWEDLESLTEFVNTVSAEDTFISFSGEKLSKEEEMEYLASVFVSIEKGDMVKLFCEIDGQLAGVADVRRDVARRKRAQHIGIFGLVISKDYRGDGIGERLMADTLAQAKKEITGLHLIWLHCFLNNTIALHLYTKLGFHQVGKIPEELYYKGTYVDGVQMIKKI